MSDDWTPAFPGQRPPFRPGNQWRVGAGNHLATKHGANSPRYYLPLAKQIAAELRAQIDYLNTPRFKAPLQAYAEARARADLYQWWMESLPFEQQATAHEDNGHPPLEQWRQMSTRADNLAERIGLTPMPKPDVLAQIKAAQATIARRQARKQTEADLRAAIRAQQDARGDK